MNVRNQNLNLIRNSNPHIRITRLTNIRMLIITIFAITLFLIFFHYFLYKSKFLVFSSRSNNQVFFHNFFYLN